MLIIKSIIAGLIVIILGNLLAFVLSLLTGLIIEPLLENKMPESSLKKFRHCWSYAWIGLTVGIINSLLIYFYKLNGWILLVIFIVYLVFFMKHKTEFILFEVCGGDFNQFKKLSRITEIATFICFILGLYGVWTLLVL